MKHRFHCIILLFCGLAGPLTAQFPLEHTYATSESNRILVPGAGERYLLWQYSATTNGNPSVLWYDGDHNFLNAVEMQLEPNTISIGQADIATATANFFDNDPGIEVAIKVQDQLFQSRMQVFDDTGEPLSGLLWNKITLITTTDGAHQVISRKEIRSVPGFALVHEFTDAHAIVRYKVLEDGTGVYWYINSLGQLVVRNNDFSIHSVLGGVNPLDNCWLIQEGDLSRFAIDPDNDLEWYYSVNCGGDYRLRFYSGNTLMTEYSDSLNFFTWLYPPDSTTGLDHPVLHLLHQDAQGTVFINALTGAVDYYSPDRLVANITEDGELLYYPLRVPATATSFPVYDRSYNLWKTLPKLAGQEFFVQEISTRTYDTDPGSVEFSGAYAQPLANLDYYIIREDGDILYQAELTAASGPSRLPGLANKLIVRRFAGGVFYTRVYLLPSSTPLPTAEPAAVSAPAELTTTPNPAADWTYIELSAFEGERSTVTVADALGRTVFRRLLDTTPAQLQVACNDWTPGVYTMTIQTPGRRASGRFIRN